ncbi:MAG: methylamine dehydrogenase (amicyanin) light chain, partial [Sphingobium sp.]
MKRFDADAMGEKLLRRFAGGSSRRSMLTRLGAALVAAPAF